MSPAHFEIKGWCPGALRPMESGDGLIVRIRPHAASLSCTEMRGIADAAERFGNGHIDLTRRANLQIRGVTAEALEPLHLALKAGDLLDESTEVEAIRNILISPLAGLDPLEILDVRPLALELAGKLAVEPAALALPAKFSFVLEGSGQLPLWAERADIRLVACAADSRPMVAIARDAEWIGMIEPQNAAAAICAIIAGKALNLQPVETLNVQNKNIQATCSLVSRQGAGHSWIGLGVPFGRLKVDQLRALAEIATEVRLSPWRVLYLVAAEGTTTEHIREMAREAGFATEPDEPLMRIQACPGRPACRAAWADTRADAAKIARWMETNGFPGTAHLSGCAKGCASSAPADIILVGTPDGYRLMRNAAARAEGGLLVAASEILPRLTALMQESADG